MTKEQLETIKEYLEECCESTHEIIGGITRYDCCHSKPANGHIKECIAMESIKIIEKEIDVLETEEQIKFQNGLKYP